MSDANHPREANTRAVTISGETYEKIAAIARSKGRSISRVIEDLLEAVIEAEVLERKQFFELAERLRNAANEDELAMAKSEFARMIFGK
jgi:predicted CopG family antitoxin